REVAGDQVYFAVAVNVAGGAGEVVALDFIDGVPGELARLRLLEKDDCIQSQFFSVRKGVAGKIADSGNIEQAVAIEIGGHCPHGPIHSRQMMVLEGELSVPRVLQP